MDYTNFNVEDFASDDRFINWVKNACPEEEKDFWRLLALSNPDLQEKMERARTLVLNVDRAENKIHPVDPGKIQELWQNILVGIDDPSTEQEIVIPERKKSPLLIWACVATCLGLLIATFLWVGDPASDDQWHSYHDAPGFIALENTAEKSMRVEMTDGSVISLERNSRIKYKNNYATDSVRSVYLQGEAFFEVARDPQKPFVVFTNNIATEVLGTSFRVSANKDGEKVIVAVKTGKVSVYAIKNQPARVNDPKAGVILFPNQEVVYTRHADSFEKKLVDTPHLVAPPAFHNNFTFEHAPIDSVFAKLQRAYGVEILFDRETMKNCFITAPLRSEPLFEKLKIICRTIGASYEVIDAKVVIRSTGCKKIDIDDLN